MPQAGEPLRPTEDLLPETQREMTCHIWHLADSGSPAKSFCEGCEGFPARGHEASNDRTPGIGSLQRTNSVKLGQAESVVSREKPWGLGRLSTESRAIGRRGQDGRIEQMKERMRADHLVYIVIWQYSII